MKVGRGTYKLTNAAHSKKRVHPWKNMDNSNDKTRKRDIFRHGLDKATSKFGLSSQSQTGPSHLYNAMASTGKSLFSFPLLFSAHLISVTNSMSVMPAVSQAHKNAYYSAPPVWTHVDNPDESV
jgi:hypothetical protein